MHASFTKPALPSSARHSTFSAPLFYIQKSTFSCISGPTFLPFLFLFSCFCHAFCHAFCFLSRVARFLSTSMSTVFFFMTAHASLSCSSSGCFCKGYLCRGCFCKGYLRRGYFSEVAFSAIPFPGVVLWGLLFQRLLFRGCFSRSCFSEVAYGDSFAFRDDILDAITATSRESSSYAFVVGNFVYTPARTVYCSPRMVR